LLLNTRKWIIFIFLAALGWGASAAETGKKVISLAPAITQTIIWLGRGDALIGRSSACLEPADAVANIPVMGDFARPEVEKIVLAKPDYLLLNDMENPASIRTFEKFGIKVINKQCSSIDDYIEWVMILGDILNANHAAVAEIKRAKAALTEFEGEETSQRKTALWVIWDAPLMVAGKGSLPDEVMRLANLDNVAKDVTPDYFKASFEWLLRRQPDIIIWPGVSDSKYAELKKMPGWSNLEAVKHDRFIRNISPEQLQIPGPAIFDGIRQLKQQVKALGE